MDVAAWPLHESAAAPQLLWGVSVAPRGLACGRAEATGTVPVTGVCREMRAMLTVHRRGREAPPYKCSMFSFV